MFPELQRSEKSPSFCPPSPKQSLVMSQRVLVDDHNRSQVLTFLAGSWMQHPEVNKCFLGKTDHVLLLRWGPAIRKTISQQVNAAPLKVQSQRIGSIKSKHYLNVFKCWDLMLRHYQSMLCFCCLHLSWCRPAEAPARGCPWTETGTSWPRSQVWLGPGTER